MSKASKRRVLRPANIALAVVAILVVVFGVMLATRDTQSADDPAQDGAAPATLSVPQRFSALFTGDSFTAGAGVGGALNAYVHIASNALGWACDVDAEGSTGFVNPGIISPGGAPRTRMIDRLDDDHQKFVVNLLVIDGGRNDLGYQPGPVTIAIADYVHKARALWPQAKIAMIVPTYMTPVPADNYAAIRDSMAQVAASEGAVVIDPIAEGWYANVNLKAMEISDGAHPNALGNEFIAAKLEQSLKAHGIGADLSATPPTATATAIATAIATAPTPASVGGN